MSRLSEQRHNLRALAKIYRSTSSKQAAANLQAASVSLQAFIDLIEALDEGNPSEIHRITAKYRG